MRSSSPMPGNPWPHDMVISIEDAPHALLELLWIREAWQLHPVGDDLPPLLDRTPAPAARGSRTAADLTRWEEQWPAIWDAAAQHAATPTDRSIFDALTKTADGSAERAELLTRLAGPSWRDELGDDALGEGYADWEAGAPSRIDGYHVPLDEQPERVALDALIPAWRAGLTQIVTLPCLGEYIRVIRPHGLITTEATRSDPSRFRAALDRFS